MPDDIAVRPTHHIVLFEGLYANVSEGAWRRAAELFDERWVLECADDAIHERLVARHVSTGVAADAHEAKWRGALRGLALRGLELDRIGPRRGDESW